jgi:ABC-2 type transport system permease protein/oleandomycin transport system permease protein
MVAIGYLVGFRVHTGFLGLLAGMAVMLFFGFSLTWIFAIIGLSVTNAETAQAASFPILAPLVFASSAFVPVDTMPSWLQPWAENQPVSVVINAARALTIGGPTTELVLKSIAWIVGIVLVFAPLAIRRYRQVA